MTDQVDDPGNTPVDEDDEEARRTHEGNAHADHVETGEQTRGSVQRWGANSPGQNSMAPAGDSEPPAEGEKLPNES